MSKYVVFGETSCNTTDSLYTYANALTLDIMELLGEDTRFLDWTQADVVNLALVVLYGFLRPQDHDEVSKAKLKEFVEDFNEFKDFAFFTMVKCREKNRSCNLILADLIDKEVK